MIQIGKKKYPEKEVQKAYSENKYLVTSAGLFQIGYSAAQNQYYGWKICECKGLVKHGKYAWMNAKEVNECLKTNILI